MAKQKNVSHTQINLSQYLKAFTEIKNHIFITYPALYVAYLEKYIQYMTYFYESSFNLNIVILV